MRNGKLEGKLEEKLEIAKKLISFGISKEEVIKITNLKQEDLENL